MSTATTDYDDATGGLTDALSLLGKLVPPEEWEQAALCAQTDPEVFFPDRGGSSREAKSVCAKCPVQALCLDRALNADERFGISGGTSERERRAIAKKPDVRAQVRRDAIYASYEWRLALQPATIRALHVVSAIEPAEEVEVMKDKDRFQSIITFLEQLPGQSVTIHLIKRSIADHKLMIAAHVSTMNDLRRVLRRLGKEDPRVELVEDANSIMIVIVGPTTAAKNVDASVEPPQVAPDPRATSQNETPVPVVFPVTTRTAQPKVAPPRISQSKEPDEAEFAADVPTKRLRLALVQPPAIRKARTSSPRHDAQRQRALSNFQDMAANAPNDSARSFWQTKIDELLGVAKLDANTA